MELYLKRAAHTKNSTFGVFYFPGTNTGLGNPFGFIIEDEPRAEKVKGKTRIPAKRYKLGIRKEVTPLTAKCRKSKWYAGWFEYFIEILEVENFTGIYIHIGNTEEHSAGCLLGASSVKIKNGEYIGVNSSVMVKELYARIYPLLKAKKEVYLTIIDE